MLNYARSRCRLLEIDPTARYTVALYRTYALEETTTVMGSELQDLQVDIRERPGSVIIEYIRR
jgi:hypothetical protein